MTISTQFGVTPYTATDVERATGIVPTAATRKLNTFEQRLVGILRACRALDPTGRTCELAESVVAMMVTGGGLAELDRKRLVDRVRVLAEQAEQTGTSGT